ncbi:MAG: hypothetical protein ACRBN8_35820 [Nannocystales bacterium]
MTEPVTVGYAELAELLQGALGEERAALAITTAADALGVSGGPYSSAAALEILGVIAEQAGLVGISARFARSRLLSRMTAQSLEQHGVALFVDPRADEG